MRPGDPIVLVAAAARHRRDAFAAADFAMDHLKSDAWFWKREKRGGEWRWIEPRAEDHADLGALETEAGLSASSPSSPRDASASCFADLRRHPVARRVDAGSSVARRADRGIDIEPVEVGQRDHRLAARGFEPGQRDLRHGPRLGARLARRAPPPTALRARGGLGEECLVRARAPRPTSWSSRSTSSAVGRRRRHVGRGRDRLQRRRRRARRSRIARLGYSSDGAVAQAPSEQPSAAMRQAWLKRIAMRLSWRPATVSSAANDRRKCAAVALTGRPLLA